MAASSIDALFNPASIAVVGASQREESIGQRVIRNLVRFGFQGSIYPVHPTNAEVAGLACHKSLADIPGPVDAVFIGLPAAQGPGVLEEAGKRGVRAAYINASGFADADAEGVALQAELRAIAARYDMALCGPNNLGLFNVHRKYAPWTPRYASELVPGPVAVISQSGTMALMLCQDERKLGLAYVVTCGNEGVLGAAEYLDYVVRDDTVKTVLLFLETIRNPDLFAAAAHEAHRRGKRVIALKSGASDAGRALVAAHTGSLAGEDRFYDAFLRSCHVTRVHSPDELIESALLFTAHSQGAKGRGFMAVTLSGGEAALIADNAPALGLALPPLTPATREALMPAFPPFGKPSNPLDAWGLGFSPERFRIVLDALVADASLGAIGFSIVANTEGGPDGVYGRQMAEACAEIAGKHDKAIVFMNATAGAGPNREIKKVLDGAGIPYLSGMRTSLASIAHWLRPDEPVRQAIAADAQWAARCNGLKSEVEGFALLREAGVPMARAVAAGSAAEAVAAAETFGYPVVLKGCAPSLPHKSELGLVKVGLANAEAVKAAHADLSARLAKALKPGAPGEVVVQEMAGEGVELIIAVRNDPMLGSFVVVGPGGLLVEVMGKASVRQGPVDLATAEKMLDETAAGALVCGVRGRGPFDRKAAAAAIVALSRAGAKLHGAAATLEINPLIVTAGGALGVDLLIESH
ncbi:MAG: acetate--CoA ligase family protein [Burkholderiales bacterium]